MKRVAKTLALDVLIAIPIALTIAALIWFFGGVVLGLKINFVIVVRAAYLACLALALAWDMLVHIGAYWAIGAYAKHYQMSRQEILEAIGPLKIKLQGPDRKLRPKEEIEREIKLKRLVNEFADTVVREMRFPRFPVS